ncbi:hypothetical protein AB2B41_12755, partial [Marimonas sp. MJW-29]
SLHPARMLELLLRGRICFYVNWKSFRTSVILCTVAVELVFVGDDFPVLLVPTPERILLRRMTSRKSSSVFPTGSSAAFADPDSGCADQSALIRCLALVLRHRSSSLQASFGELEGF